MASVFMIYVKKMRNTYPQRREKRKRFPQVFVDFRAKNLAKNLENTWRKNLFCSFCRQSTIYVSASKMYWFLVMCNTYKKMIQQYFQRVNWNLRVRRSFTSLIVSRRTICFKDTSVILKSKCFIPYVYSFFFYQILI